MKIKKNLSDAEMLKGYQEKLTFENSSQPGEPANSVRVRGKQPQGPEKILLTEEARARLNRFLLEISMEWLQKQNGACSWKVTRENDQIIIKPAAVKANA